MCDRCDRRAFGTGTAGIAEWRAPGLGATCGRAKPHALCLHARVSKDPNAGPLTARASMACGVTNGGFGLAGSSQQPDTHLLS